MTAPTPPPLPERPLIEAWSIRAHDGVRVGSGLSDDRAWAERELQVHAGGQGTVVPLIAADRLTLVDEVADGLHLGSSDRDIVADYLAALRTHLEHP